MDNRRDTFTYTYSAQQQQEIENIRKKYLPQQEDKMAQLRNCKKCAACGEENPETALYCQKCGEKF